MSASEWADSLDNDLFRAKVRAAVDEALLDQLRNIVVRNMDIIHKTFLHYAGGMGDDGGIGLGKNCCTLRMDDFNDFVIESEIAEEIGETHRLPGLELLSLRDVFAQVSSDYHDDAIVTSTIDLLKMRSDQFVQVLVLIAQMQQEGQTSGDGGDMDLVTTFDRLINAYLRTNTHFSPTDIGYWYRKQRIYIEDVSDVLGTQLQLLKGVYQRCKRTSGKLSLAAWMAFVRSLIVEPTEEQDATGEDVRLLPSPTNRVYVTIFFQSWHHRPVDGAASATSRQIITLDFCDFLEALVRLADALPILPSE